MYFGFFLVLKMDVLPGVAYFAFSCFGMVAFPWCEMGFSWFKGFLFLKSRWLCILEFFLVLLV